jgi:hypothetical protein
MLEDGALSEQMTDNFYFLFVSLALQPDIEFDVVVKEILQGRGGFVSLRGRTVLRASCFQSM